MGTIFLGYGTITVSGQALGSDQPCSASTPCHKICGDHPCTPGEVQTAPQIKNQTRTQNNGTITTPQMTNQTMAQNATMPSMTLPLKFSTKGQISNSSGLAPGTVVWTILNGNDTTFVFHGLKGLEVIRLTTSPEPICNNAQNQICLDGTVIKSRDPDQISTTGGQVKINIHPIQNQETVGFLSGPFQNILLQIDLTKTWAYSGASTNSNTAIANPASTYCINHGGTLQMKTGPAGQYGMCAFPNGSQCEEWQYYRGECSPTQASTTNSTSMHGTSVNPNSTNSTVQITNSTYR